MKPLSKNHAHRFSQWIPRSALPLNAPSRQSLVPPSDEALWGMKSQSCPDDAGTAFCSFLQVIERVEGVNASIIVNITVLCLFLFRSSLSHSSSPCPVLKSGTRPSEIRAHLPLPARTHALHLSGTTTGGSDVYAMANLHRAMYGTLPSFLF